jgi:hypothetical protein
MHRRRAARTCPAAVAAVAAWCALPPTGIARAEHDMASMSEAHHGGGSTVSAGISIEAARFDNVSYLGSHQGITPSVSWTISRFGVAAALGMYHLTKNGLSAYGIGDAMFTGHAAIITAGALETGLALHMMVPTGSELKGFGMGHVMAMPSAWATWQLHPVVVNASLGYGRALADLGGAEHNHGPAPLVDPMNMQELTWSGGADVDVVDRVRIGGRVLGAMPIGTGTDRLIGAGRLAWGTPRLSTSFEVQLGIVGDPFTVRGVVETALRF